MVKFIKYLALSAVLCILCNVSLAQSRPSGLVTSRTDGPPPDGWTKLFFNSSTVKYICWASNDRPRYALNQTSISNAASAVVTKVAHGLSTEFNPTVTITGGTGNWAAFNGTYIATVIDADTFSVPVNTSTFGAVTGTITIYLTSPRTNQPEWKIERLKLDGSGEPTSHTFAIGGFSNICSSYASLSYQ